MSSSFLYLAIVGVWALVLVPRWLRRQYARVQRPVEVDVDVEVEYAAEYDAGAQYYYDEDGQDAQPGGYSAASNEASYAATARAGEMRPARSTQVGMTVSRARMLRSRRRLLTMHLLLIAVAGACVALKITSWLVIIPPAAMLGLYLLLLREAAVADAGQAQRRAAMEARVLAARQRAYDEELAREPEPSAEIIDISARVGDQLYDQYADATVRAVGD